QKVRAVFARRTRRASRPTHSPHALSHSAPRSFPAMLRTDSRGRCWRFMLRLEPRWTSTSPSRLEHPRWIALDTILILCLVLESIAMLGEGGSDEPNGSSIA